VLKNVDKIICHEDVVMEDSSEYVDFNIWPFNTGGLESITGGIERDLDTTPQHEKDAIQKEWKL